jgi:hypothetical protein
VELDAGGALSLYFIGPKNGGLEIEHQGKEITVITPQSPLGQNLVGKHICGPFCIQAVRSPDRTVRSLRIWTYAKNCASNLSRSCFMAAFHYRANPLPRDLLEIPCLP